MTTEQLILILAMPPAEAVKALQVSSFTVPKWSDLKKQYDPMKHKIQDTAIYPAKLNEFGQDDFKRTSLGLQKLAVARIAQSMFSTPTQRHYNYDRESEEQQKAVDLLEQVYRTDNYIDSENIERAKALNATCQIVTVWHVFEKEYKVGEDVSKLTLSHRTYSEKDGYKIYAITDNNGLMLVVSIAYTDSSNTEHMAVYTNEIVPRFIMFDKDGDWVVNTEVTKPLEVFPVVYANLVEPVWGGDEGTNLVEQLEEMESYQGLYIKRNALPTFTQDMGDTTGMNPSETVESSNDSRRIIKVGKGGNMQDVTWEGAEKALSSRYARIRNAFFEQIQVPDTSFANMITSNTSAENKELIFADAKAKARDLGGEWEVLFQEELKIVKKFVSIMFPAVAANLETISVRSTIKPYSINSKKESAEFVAVGGAAMSLETKVRELALVDDVAAEVTAIEAENGVANNPVI
jgi:hypothetical protein